MICNFCLSNSLSCVSTSKNGYNILICTDLMELALENLGEDKAVIALYAAQQTEVSTQWIIEGWPRAHAVSHPSYLSLSGIWLIIFMTFKKTVLFSNGWGFNGQPKRSEATSSILLPQHNSIQFQLHWQSFWPSAINLTAKTLALLFLHFLSQLPPG